VGSENPIGLDRGSSDTTTWHPSASWLISLYGGRSRDKGWALAALSMPLRSGTGNDALSSCDRHCRRWSILSSSAVTTLPTFCPKWTIKPPVARPPTRRNAKENLFLIPTGQATLPCPTFGPCPTLSYFCPKSQTPDKHWTKWAKIQNTPIESRESSVFVARNETQKGAVNQAK